MLIVADFGLEARVITIATEHDPWRELIEVACAEPKPLRFIVDREARGTMDMWLTIEKHPVAITPARKTGFRGSAFEGIPIFFFEELEYVE